MIANPSAVRYGMRLFGQAVVYAGIALVFGYFATRPVYHPFDASQAMIKLSFAHGAAAKGGCRRLTSKEIAALPANMRRPLDCPRERLPVLIEVQLDGKTLYRESLAPTGLSGDGQSSVYKKFSIAPGKHLLAARLRDSNRDTGFDYERSEEIVLSPRQNFIIDFRAHAGGFIFR